MDATKLYERHTMQELVEMDAREHADPANMVPPLKWGTYNVRGHRRFDAIARAITLHMADNREARGYPVDCDGYSGRQSNRRR